MNRGYIKLWRKSKDSGFLGNADVWQLLSWCLLKASHKSHRVLVGKQLVSLEPGQLVFGRTSVAKELNSTEKKIRTSLELLKNANFLTTKTASKYSIISIVNWHIYQDEGPSMGQQDGQYTGQEGASKGPAKGHKQECKNINTREEEKKHANACSSADASAPADVLAPFDAKEKGKNPRSGFPQCPYQKIIASYHEILPELPPVRGLSETRKGYLNARWKESLQRLKKAENPYTEESGLAWWGTFFQRIRAAPHYLHGFQRKDGTYWKPPGLFWFLTPENFLKIIENGHVENRRAA